MGRPLKLPHVPGPTILHILYPSGWDATEGPHERLEIDLAGIPRHQFEQELGRLLKGKPRMIPYFDTLEILEGEGIPCTAYVREDFTRKDLPVNAWAQALWLQSQARKQVARREEGLGDDPEADAIPFPQLRGVVAIFSKPS